MTANGQAGAITLHALVIPNRGWPVLLDRARQLADLGAHTVWIDDHLMHPATPSGPWLDAWSVLAAWAASTDGIDLGSLVSNSVLRAPAVLARQALSVDSISAGRLQLGLGAGYAATDHASVGSEPWAYEQRQSHFREYAQVVDAVLRGEPVERPGAAVLPPQQPCGPRKVPLTIAAHSRSSLRLAAELGDRWVSFGGFGMATEEQLRRTGQRLRALAVECDRVGRDPASLRCAILMGSAATTREPIWLSVDAARRAIERYHSLGIDDVILYYPPDEVWPDGATAPRAFERLLQSYQESG